MKKTLIALAAVATVAVGSISTPNTAEARCRGCGVAAGVLGGIAAGAIIGGAIANSGPRYYRPSPGYVVYDEYDAAYPVDCRGGYWARRPVRFDRWGNPVRWSRARFICP